MYIYIHIHIQIHIPIHIHIPMHIHIPIHIHIHILCTNTDNFLMKRVVDETWEDKIRLCIILYIYDILCMYIYICIYTYIYTGICVCVCVYIYIYMCVCMCYIIFIVMTRRPGDTQPLGSRQVIRFAKLRCRGGAGAPEAGFSGGVGETTSATQSL